MISNDNESDAEYCERIFGQDFEYLIPDDWREPSQEQKIFYLLWTPSLCHLKIGKADDEKNLLLRLQERTRQCGKTMILGIKYCFDPTEEEKFWKDNLCIGVTKNTKIKAIKIAREVFDLSANTELFDYLIFVCNQRNVITGSNLWRFWCDEFCGELLAENPKIMANICGALMELD